MKKKKLPILLRVEKKLKAKLENGASVSQAAEYVYRTTQSFRDKKAAILAMAGNINPMITEKAGQLSRKAAKTKKNREISIRAERARTERFRNECEKNRIQSLRNDFDEAKSKGIAVRWGVALSPCDWEQFFSDGEIKEIKALRREKLSTQKVRDLLDCSLAELNRWDTEGLLPHAFKQFILVGGRSVKARFWLESEVSLNKSNIADWRKSHELKKLFKRKKSPLKIVT